MAEPTYTVFIRVPIPRGDFVDPPPVSWDSVKDDALWKILSGAAQTEINWNRIADHFDVPVDFLLQQVAYLTERHASQVRAQVRKATAAAKGGGSSAPSPIPGFDSAAGIRSIRRDSPVASGLAEGSGTRTPLDTSVRPNISRNASTNTAVLRDGGGSPRPNKGLQGWAAEQTGRRRLSSLPITTSANRTPTPTGGDASREETSPEPADSESTTSEDESSPAQSRIIRRPPRNQQQEPSTAYDDDEGDESEPAFQPYRPKPEETQGSANDLTSTLRGGLNRGGSKRGGKSSVRQSEHHSQTSDSDTSSPAIVQRPGNRGEQRTPGPLSPRRAAEVAGRSPSSKGYSREGSEGTPSMGSSYSDLDDTSVTQSALEEALASHMNHGAGSRFSISQAFRSRYTPSGNP